MTWQPWLQRVAGQLVLDGASLVAVFLPWLLIKYVAAPATRGFYCADPSLRLPYHASTVTTPTNVVLSYGAGLAAVLAAHWGRGAWRHTSARAALLGVWEEATLFIFGGLTVQVVGGPPRLGYRIDASPYISLSICVDWHGGCCSLLHRDQWPVSRHQHSTAQRPGRPTRNLLCCYKKCWPTSTQGSAAPARHRTGPAPPHLLASLSRLLSALVLGPGSGTDCCCRL